jgi:uncharacterized protein YqeY
MEISLKQQINDRLKQAMISKDKQTMDLMRMLKARMTEKLTSKGFEGQEDDALWLAVIEAYSKQLLKALEEYKALGEQGAAQVAQLTWDIEAMKIYLPTKADEATLTGWAQEAIAALGGKENAKAGQVIGAVMKAHKDESDPNLLKQIVTQLLA